MANRKGLSTISSLPRLIRQLRTAEWKIVGQNAFPAPYISLQTDSKCFTSRLWNDKCQPRKSSRPRSRFSQTQTLSHGSGDNYGNRCSTTKHTVTPESLLMKIGVLSCLPSRVYSNTANDLERDLDDVKLLLKNKLQEKKIDSDSLDKQMNVLDVLLQHRLKHVDSDAVKDETSKLKPSEVFVLASDLFNLQDKVGEEAITLAAPLFRLAAIAGDINAKYSYAQLLRTGQGGIDRDVEESVTIFSELAQKGHPYAQFALAGMYFSGLGTEQNYETAYTLYQVCAENGINQAYDMIGKMYLDGFGVKLDSYKAFEYFKKGAEKGDTQALMSMAHCYTQGKGVEVDHKLAFECHQRAAEKGHATAIYNLGTHYFSGRGVELDMKKASEYFSKAAGMGFAFAQINLGNMYYHGLGVEKDWNKAKDLYKKAAPTNHNARLLLEELEHEMKQNDNDK